MFVTFFLISFFLLEVKGGELIIVETPPSIKFQGDDPIDQHLVPEILSLAMGFTTQQESDWGGMAISNPFDLAKAAVVLYIDGITSLGNKEGMLKYALNNNEDEFSTWKTIKNRINDRYPMENNTLMRVELGLHEDFQQLSSLKHLDISNTEDAAFLKEISNLDKYMSNVKKTNGIPDFYWFVMKSLHQLSDLKGSHHASTVEAKEMVSNSLLKLSKLYNSAYNGRALVVALVSDASHTRRTRSVAMGQDTPNSTDALKENIYDPDFPVIFNIILWFTVTLFFSLLAVSVFIASMDPGRDSIIYRMTSNRMKKDS